MTIKERKPSIKRQITEINREKRNVRRKYVSNYIKQLQRIVASLPDSVLLGNFPIPLINNIRRGCEYIGKIIEDYGDFLLTQSYTGKECEIFSKLKNKASEQVWGIEIVVMSFEIYRESQATNIKKAIKDVVDEITESVRHIPYSYKVILKKQNAKKQQLLD